MDVDELLSKANDSISVSRAYGPPIESGGASSSPLPARRAAPAAAAVATSGNQGSGRGMG